jgi:hypothetical protein
VTITETLVDELLSMPEDQFRVEVDRDLRREEYDTDGPDRYQARRAALRCRDPQLTERWYTLLLRMACSVDGQLAAMHEDNEAKKASLRSQIADAAHNRDDRRSRTLARQWEKQKEGFSTSRAKLLRFKTGLDEWVIEARMLYDSTRNSMYEQIVAEERNHWAAETSRLRSAIREHQQAILDDDGVDASPADEKLWEALVAPTG